MVALCGGCHRVKGFHFLVNEGKCVRALVDVRKSTFYSFLVVRLVSLSITVSLTPFLTARRDVYALLKRYFIDPTGKTVVRVHFDHACSLHEVIANRDPQAALGLEIVHDRYVSRFY